jgi:hypothetical protein|uniref:Uncharacterized protein n=1 Tax=Siphoviridae sp. ctfhy6 TaxID=2825597 RepID=A0A8S5VAN9_9CAUD|nr:MAG TPA: hypothetical protein [Siphoviridae sp. ctfhy6]
MSLSDGAPMMTMPVAPANNYGGGMGMWGDSWIWIIVLFLFGWGRNGFGNGNGGGVMDGYVLTSDFASVERKLDSIANGVCDSTFALNNAISGGFATTTQAINTGFGNAELSRANQQAALMQQLNAMQMQAANCCCENRAAIAQVRYDMATQACDTRNTVNTAARDIIDANNQNSRAILDFLTQSKLSDLQTENQNLKLAASQAAQNNYLISQLRPCPSPAYITCNPWAGSGYGGCGSGCGC